MYVVYQYLDTGKTVWLNIGPFDTRDLAEQWALDHCQVFGWIISVLLPTDVKVNS